MTLEKTLERLQQIVEVLEKGEQPLEELLKLFEEGVTLVRTGEKTLSEAELRVDVLLKDGTTSPVDVATVLSTEE